MLVRHLSLAMFMLAAAMPAAASANGKLRFDSGLHAYVEARFAQGEQALDRAAEAYAAALKFEPGNSLLQRRAFELALAAGNRDLSFAMAEQLARADSHDSTVSLVLATSALMRADWSRFEQQRAKLAEAGYAAFAAPVLKAWAQQARGERADAIETLTSIPAEPLAASYVSEHRAYLLAAAGHWIAASLVYDELLAGPAGSDLSLRLAAAHALQQQGKAEAARKLLMIGDGRHPVLRDALARLDRGRLVSAGPTTATAGAAALFRRIAQDLSRERPLPIALVLARLATYLNPADEAALMTVADLLQQAEQNQAALAMLGRIPADGAYLPVARASQAAILGAIDQKAQALAVLEAGVAMPQASAEDWARYGDALRDLERFSDAVQAYDKAIALQEQRPAGHWQLYFLRGTAKERAGDWQSAEADLRKALLLAPDQALILNYLGYSLLDRGLRPDEAQALIAKAHALKPDDGYITDSLGWAHYRQGRYADAVRLLEEAFALVPEDATVGEHLGDAYWRTGRFLEARHRWQGALDSQPDTAQRKRLQVKLDLGLDLALAKMDGAIPQ